jgi:hypothetical protein
MGLCEVMRIKSGLEGGALLMELVALYEEKEKGWRCGLSIQCPPVSTNFKK